MEKIPTHTKERVGYSDSLGTTGARCCICESYLGEGDCERVKGKVSPDGWCKLFEAD